VTEQPPDRLLKALKAIADVQSGTSRHINSADAEECCDRGWAEAAPGMNSYSLTAAGRKLLSNLTK